MLSCVYPNPWVLLCIIVQKLNIAETTYDWLKAGNPAAGCHKPSKKYTDLQVRRSNLMESYAKGEIEKMDYLKEIGKIQSQ